MCYSNFEIRQEGSTFAAEDNGLLRDTHKFQLLNSDEITKLEKQPGSTPVVPQTTVPPSERNKALNVTNRFAKSNHRNRESLDQALVWDQTLHLSKFTFGAISNALIADVSSNQ